MGTGFSIVKAWTKEEFGEMVKSLGKAYIRYEQIILDNGIDGEVRCHELKVHNH
jgi:hypothetical protein